MRCFPAALAISAFVFACAPADDSTVSAPEALRPEAIDCDCPAGSVCIDTAKIEPFKIPARSRVAVVWSQLDGADPDPRPQIAFDQPLAVPLYSADGGQLVVPLYSIDPPEREALLFCERDCADEDLCACRTDVRVATGDVFVTSDTNGDERLDMSEIETATFGRAHFVIGRSEARVETPSSFGGTFFGRFIPEGVRAYHFVADEDAVRIEAGGRKEHQRLYLCPPGSESCQLPFPHIGR